jgi:hypothetical protein
VPYGCWSTESGREILFDRSYSPICERRDGGPPQLADPTEWVRDIVKQDWFYNDGTAQTGKEKAAMKHWQTGACWKPSWPTSRGGWHGRFAAARGGGGKRFW